MVHNHPIIRKARPVLDTIIDHSLEGEVRASFVALPGFKRLLVDPH